MLRGLPNASVAIIAVHRKIAENCLNVAKRYSAESLLSHSMATHGMEQILVKYGERAISDMLIRDFTAAMRSFDRARAFLQKTEENGERSNTD